MALVVAGGRRAVSHDASRSRSLGPAVALFRLYSAELKGAFAQQRALECLRQLTSKLERTEALPQVSGCVCGVRTRRGAGQRQRR